MIEVCLSCYSHVSSILFQYHSNVGGPEKSIITVTSYCLFAILTGLLVTFVLAFRHVFIHLPQSFAFLGLFFIQFLMNVIMTLGPCCSKHPAIKGIHLMASTFQFVTLPYNFFFTLVFLSYSLVAKKYLISFFPPSSVCSFEFIFLTDYLSCLDLACPLFHFSSPCCNSLYNTNDLLCMCLFKQIY